MSNQFNSYSQKWYSQNSSPDNVHPDSISRAARYSVWSLDNEQEYKTIGYLCSQKTEKEKLVIVKSDQILEVLL